MSVGALYLGAGVVGLGAGLAFASLPVALTALVAVAIGVVFLEGGL